MKRRNFLKCGSLTGGRYGESHEHFRDNIMAL
jgi:hypothetical protein